MQSLINFAFKADAYAVVDSYTLLSAAPTLPRRQKKHDRASETDDDVAWQALHLQNLQFGIV